MPLALAFFLLAGLWVSSNSVPWAIETRTTRRATPRSSKTQVALRRLGHLRVCRGEVALGSYMVSYGLSLDILEDIQSSEVLGAMAGVAAFIKGIDVSGLDAKGVGCIVDVLLGGAMLGRFAGSGLMGWVSPSRLLAAAGLCAVVLIGVHFVEWCACVVVLAGRGLLQQHYVRPSSPWPLRTKASLRALVCSARPLWAGVHSPAVGALVDGKF